MKRTKRGGEERLDAVAVILARAGSKGVPGKNLAPVGGRACIEWTIDAALESKRVALAVVSTDSRPIAKLAAGRGVMVINRPAALASDTATVDSAARHAIGELETVLATELHERQPIVILYANVPIRPAGLIDRAVARLTETGADSVQSYAPVGKHHPWWTARVDERSGAVKAWEGTVLNHGVYRRQALPPAFIPDGGVLVVTRRALMLEVKGSAKGPHAFFGKDRRAVVNGEGAVVDIDSRADLLVADVLLREARAGGRKAGGGRKSTNKDPHA